MTTDRAREAFQHWYIAYQRNWCKSEGEAPDSLVAWEAWNAARADMAEELVKSMKARTGGIPSPAEADYDDYRWGYDSAMKDAIAIIREELNAGGNLERHEPEPSDSGVTNPGQLGDALNTAPPAPPLTADGGNYEWPKDAGGGGGGT